MWLFTPKGFYSVVQKRQDRAGDTLTIRTRNRADIDALKEYFPDAKPFRVKASDYAWRIRVPRQEWAAAVARMALEVDYSNFKDRVTEVQGHKRHAVYLRVWSALLTLRDTPRRSTRKRRSAVEWEWDDASPMLTDRDYDDLLGGRL